MTLHGEQLKTDFRVINTGDKPFEFTTALHTYIEVLDVNKAKVRQTIACLAAATYLMWHVFVVDYVGWTSALMYKAR